MGEEEGSFRGSGLSPWGSEVGLLCSSTNVSAMHAIPAGEKPRQPLSAQHWVHPYKPCLQPATPHLGPLCHHLGCAVPHGRQGPQEGMQPGEHRPAVPVGSQGKKHGVWHQVSPSPQESLSCSVTAAFTLSCRSLLGCPAPYARGKYLHLPQEGLYTERSRMGLTIPILLRDRVQSPDTVQQPSPGYEGLRVPAEEGCIHDNLLQITLTAPSPLYKI